MPARRPAGAVVQAVTARAAGTVRRLPKAVRFPLYVVVAVSLALAGYRALFALVVEGGRLFLMLTGFDAEVADRYAAALARGAEVTLHLTALSASAGLVLGLFAGLAKLSRKPLLHYPAAFYIWVIRGTPVLVQILFAYNGLPILLRPLWEPLMGLGLPPIQDVLTAYWAAFVALSLNVGAYNAEVVRAAILSVPRGQWEAAQSVGLSSAQVMRYVVIAQSVRIAVPPLVNNLVALLKDSSLASAIALLELVLAGQRIVARTFRPVEIFAAVALIYLTLTTVLTFFTNWLERHLATSGER